MFANCSFIGGIMREDNTPWAEKYRPLTINECILPDYIKAQAKGFVAAGNLPSLLFTGSAGCGKTTLARAIAHEMNADFMQMNASMYGIDHIRTDVMQFASTTSLTSDGKKVTLLDEADGLHHQAQQALRVFIEDFSANHMMIMTCNFASKIIEPIHSRCTTIDFKVSKSEKTTLATQFIKRVIAILEKDGIEFEKRAVAELVMKKFPDYRSIWNTLQGYSAGGKIDSGILLDVDGQSFDALITALKRKKFNDVRRWVAEHSDVDSATLNRKLFDGMDGLIEASSIPQLILFLGKHQFQSQQVADQEIAIITFLTHVMLSDIKWK